MDFQSLKLDGLLFESDDGIAFEDQSDEDIAIIGISLKLPLAETVEQFWANLCAGRDAVRPLPPERKKDTDRYFSFVGRPLDQIPYGEAAYVEDIDKFDYPFFKLSPKEASLMDPNQRVFLQTAWHALEDAGYGGTALEGSRTGVYLGYGSDADYKAMIHAVEPESLSLAVAGNVRPIIASRLSYLLNLRGPSMVVDTTCSSSLVAVHLACGAIRGGECEIALAGGIQLHLLPVREAEVGIESSTARARTFDDAADGTGTGEGAAVVVLKSYAKARADRDTVYAVIRSSAVNADGRSAGLTAPNAEAQEQVIADAWERAGIDPRSIGYVEAHGTGTKLGDPIEIDGLARAFRRYTDRKQFCGVGALKSGIGHLDSTAGIAGLIKAALSLRYRKLAPTLHVDRPNRNIPFADSPVYIVDRLTDWPAGEEKRRCGVSSFGISGTNCHVILEEAEEDGRSVGTGEDGAQVVTKPEDAFASRPRLFVLSAKSESALRKLIESYDDFVNRHPTVNVDDLCYTASMGRGHYEYRVAAVVGSAAELAGLLEKARANDVPVAMRQRWVAGMPGREAGADEHLVDTHSSGSPARIDDAMERYLASGKRDESSLASLALAYAQGANLDWEMMYRRERRCRIRLPLYPFDPHRCWLRIPAVPSGDREASDSMFHTLTWERGAHDRASADDRRPAHALLFKDNRGLSASLAALYRKSGTRVTEVEFGSSFHSASPERYTIGERESDYEALIHALDGAGIDAIVHAGAFSGCGAADEASAATDRLARGLRSVFMLVKGLAAAGWSSPLEMAVLTDRAHGVTEAQGSVVPEHAALIGLCKAAIWEYPWLTIRCIDADPDAEAVLSIWPELRSAAEEFAVAYREGGRYVQRLVPLPQHHERQATSLRTNEGVCLITGGLGGIGLHVAAQLAAQSAAGINLALLSRTGRISLSDDSGVEKENRKVRKAIAELEQLGARIDIVQADVSDERQLGEAVQMLRERYGRIAGVVHAAGVAEGNRIGDLEADMLERVLAPKIQGTMLLDRLTAPDEPDFFVLFSSAITLIGGVGSGPYTAANAYMDGYAEMRARTGKRTLSIGWPSWLDTGLSEGADIDESKELLAVITAGQGMEAFSRALELPERHIVVGRLNLQSDLFALGNRLPFRLSGYDAQTDAVNQGASGASAGQPSKTNPAFAGRVPVTYPEIEVAVTDAWRRVLGYEQPDVGANFFDIGGDSISIAKVLAHLEPTFPGRLAISDLFTYPTIAKLSGYLADARKDNPRSGTKAQAMLLAPDSQFEAAVMELFEELEQGSLNVDDAVNRYYGLEVTNG
ncbi:type I polyketide synthase [Paenibacillus methanolicus]|uniref:Polyketide synthase PksN/surfactin family lipopeptide synthetase A n=1 Tax=Paenibacillus methanolicus TaxID=582686 RepID=A0A5S5C1U2_9BACL|nr:type I polyketide synthase [Paenibacillus methanolicus]TYP72396.1 polyketide synthase PksN/surfactin family lipopeptide synthetase A [Paenibacillus methanolicus]